VAIAADHDQVGCGLLHDLHYLLARTAIADHELPLHAGSAEDAGRLSPHLRFQLVQGVLHGLGVEARARHDCGRQVPNVNDDDPGSDTISQVCHLLQALNAGRGPVSRHHDPLHPGLITVASCRFASFHWLAS